MIYEKSTNFIISSAHKPLIVEKIYDETTLVKLIMNEIKMTRTIYFNPSKQSDLHNTKNWLRIRVGDVDSDGHSKCSITYKQKTMDRDIERFARLEVEDYYEALHMFDLLEFTKTSVQETKRSKYECYYEGIRYTLCFDTWPHMEEIMFLSVEYGSNAENDDISSFIDLLGVRDIKINLSDRVDVDDEYRKRLGLEASLIPRLSFDIKLGLSTD